MTETLQGQMEELVVWGTPEIGARRQIVDIPKPGPNEVLVKVEVAGMNPKDWKYTEDSTSATALNIGDDIAGTIAAVGSSVYEYKPGDRVAAFHRMAEPYGAYAPYAIAPANSTFLLPPSVFFEAGATLPLAAMTAAIALYQALGLPQPWTPRKNGEEDVPVLIYGGATAVGAFALQLAKLSGLNPIITVAGNGIELVKSLNAATHIIDYRAGDSAYIQNEIKTALAGKPLFHAFDCAGIHGSWANAAASLQNPGGRLEMIDWGNVKDWDGENDKPGPNAWSEPEGVALHFTLVSSAYGEQHDFIDEERARKDEVFAGVWYRYLGRLVGEGKVKCHPVEVLEGGLDGVVEGLRRLKEGKVSARKLVVRIADTPRLKQ